MAILDEIKAEVESELSQQPQEEKPKSILDEVTQEVTQELYQKPELFTETQQPKEDFFYVAEKALEPVPTAAEKTSGDIFLNVISQKRSNELDDEDKSLFNSLSDDEQYKVAQARKDIPLDDAQARRIFDVEKSKMPSIPSSWEDWYNLGGDAVDVIKGVSKIPVKVGLGAAELGRDVVKATDMTVSDDEAAKNLQKAKGSFYSFMAPAFEIPEDVIWMGEKAKEGGFGWADAVGEKMGLVNPEDRFERWKGRRVVDQAHAEYFREHPTIYGRLLDSPLAKDALTYISKSQMESPEELAARTNISVEQAKAQQDEMARGSVDKLTSEMESELPEENARVRIAGEFLLPGEVGMGTMGAVSLGYKGAKNIAQGLKYIGKSADEIAEINKAAQVLQKSKLDEMLKRRTERATSVAKGAEKIEEVIQRFKPIAEKTTGALGKISAPIVGGIAGYQMSPENPLAGILTGAVGGVAARSALKGIKFGLEVPTLVKEVAEARKVAPLGKTFETLGQSAEGSALKAKLLSRGGKTIDNILSNSVEYAKTGIHGTTLALATGALESASPEEMKQMLSDGLAITLGGRALQHIKGKFMGVDPVIAQRERISDDSRIRRRYQEADPETQANIDQISDFDNAIAFRQSKLDESQTALNEAIASNKSEAIKAAQENLDLQKRQLDATKRANVQTRNEFGREFLKTYANLQDITNGVLKSGQNNVGFNILSTDQIYQKLRNNPAHSNVPDADLAQMAAQAGFYSNPAQEGVVFDRKKPSIVLNADSIRERIKLFGETPMEALVHETSHFMDVVPEFQDALGGVRSMLFQNDIRDAAGNIKATTPGIFSKAKLTELFNDGYLRHLNPEGKEAFAKLNKLWDESRGQLDENKVADYMKSEVMADLLGEITSRHLAKDLDSATLAMWDRARIKAKKNLLDRAINRFYGLGGSGDIVTAANTRAEFPPEAMAAARDAMRQIVALNGEISPPVEAPQMPKISKAQMMKNSALIERFGKDSPLFKTEFKLKVFDKDGNQIGESMPVTTPNPLEGTFQNTDGGFKKLSGYGDIPVEAQGLQVPEGGTLVVSRDLAMEPDGVTPIMYKAKDAKKLAADRRKLITESLDTDDYGTPNRFEAVSKDSETYRGTFTPAQIQAIKDMPESLIPKTLKENMLKMNEAIARGDGSRFIVDYAAVMNDNGKYQAFSPKMYDLVPIGMHLSKAGNFLVTTISVGRIFDKMRLWNERMPGRLRYWDNNLERTFDDFTKYLNNWQRGEAGETGLDADKQIALQKKNIFNDLLNLYDKASEYTNLDRTTIPRRKGDPRGKDANRTIMSMRVDHIAELLENTNATKMPVNYGFAKANFMPERMESEVTTQEKLQRPVEEERIVAATYTDPRTGEVREGVSHMAANPNAPDEQTDRESRYYGFKTDTGRVVDREEAYRIAEASGQLKEATSEEDKFNSDRGVLHSNMVEMEPTIGEKPEISPKMDADYMKAVESNDVEMQQKLVDEAAKRAGYDIRGYHGTRSPAGFTEFIPNEALGGAIFIATEPSEAGAFGRVMNVFIKADNVRKGVVRSYDEVRAIAASKKRGQDAIRVRDGVDAPINYAVFNPEQIKSADPVTYDDAGNVIPLSQRFNPKTSDIRFMPERPQDETIKPADIETSAKPDTDAVIKPYSNALVSSAGLINFLPAYHGTPFDVDKFKLEKIGTGEGAQAYGWGLYFAQARKVAQDYKEKLTDWNSPGIYDWKGMSLRSDDYKNPIRHAISLVYHQGINKAKQIGKTLQKDSEKGEPYTVEQGGLEYAKKFNDALSQVKSKKEITFEQGNLYKVDLDVKDEDLLDWDKPLSEQSEKVQSAVKKIITDPTGQRAFGTSGENIYRNLLREIRIDGSTPPKKASEKLLELGIPGIRYLDQKSRATTGGKITGIWQGEQRMMEDKGKGKWFARVQVKDRSVAFINSPTSVSTTSMPFNTREEAQAWAEKIISEGTYNYVVFDENLITILDKNDKPVEGDLPKQAPLSKGENFEVSKSGDVFVDDVTKPVKFTKDIGLQFMPARPEVNLEDYIDKPIIALTADRMGVGKAYVGPKGAEQEVSQESQGGPGFSFLYTDEKSNPVWGFTRKEDADRFVGRITSLAKKEKSDSVLVAPTLLSPDNHLHNPTGQLGYAEAINAAIKANLLDVKLADSHIEQIMQRVAAGKGMPQADKDKFSEIKSLSDFTNAVKAKEINFRQAAVIREKAAAKTLPISVDDMTRMGILPSEVAKNLSHEGFYELPTFSVVSLFEVPANQKPEKGEFHYSYPWIVRGKSIGFLKNIYNLDKLTSATNVRSKTTGELSAQPVMVVMPQLDPQKIQEAANVLNNLKKPTKK